MTRRPIKPKMGRTRLFPESLRLFSFEGRSRLKEWDLLVIFESELLGLFQCIDDKAHSVFSSWIPSEFFVSSAS